MSDELKKVREINMKATKQFGRHFLSQAVKVCQTALELLFDKIGKVTEIFMEAVEQTGFSSKFSFDEI